MSAEGLDNLNFWANALRLQPSRRFYLATPSTQGGFWLGVVSDTHLQMDMASRTQDNLPVITTDASGTQGGAWFHDAEGILQTTVFHFPNRECAPHESSNFRELSMIRIAMEKWQTLLEAFAPGRLLARSDNMVSVRAINKQTSPSIKIRNGQLSIHHLAWSMGMEVASCHIPGVENTHADILSRKTPDSGANFTSDRSDWRVLPHIFLIISQALGGFDRDACCAADGSNSLCEHFWSQACSALIQCWDNLRLWINPPFVDWSEYADKARATLGSAPRHTSITLTLPVWQGQVGLWKGLGKSRVLGFFPEGSELFDAPPANGESTSRRNIGPIPFPVVIVHFPQPIAALNRSIAVEDVVRSAACAAFIQSLPTMSGHFSQDVAMLRQLPEGLLPAVRSRALRAPITLHRLPSVPSY